MPLQWQRINWPQPIPIPNPVAAFRYDTLARFAPDTDTYDGWWQILVEPTEDDETGLLSLGEILRRSERFLPVIRVPRIYDGAEFVDLRLPVYTLYVRRSYLEVINSADAAEYGVARFDLGNRIPDDVVIRQDIENVAARSASGRDAPAAADDRIELPPQTVITAVIDNGIAIGHNLFRRKDQHGTLANTRILSFWDMDAPATPPGSGQLGRIWTTSEINTRLAAHMDGALLDEPGFYRAMQMINWDRSGFKPCAQALSHGTHVMGLTTGYDADDDTGKLRPIVAVNLPTYDVANPTGNNLAVHVDEALTHIREVQMRYRIAGTDDYPPVVVNFSFGNFAGPHDGTTVMEKLIDDRTDERPGSQFIIVLPAGNGNLSQTHAQFDLSGQTPSMAADWKVQPQDLSRSILQFWLERSQTIADDYVSLTVQAPADVGPIVIDCTPSFPGWELVDGTTPVAWLVYTPPRAPSWRGSFVLAAAPTASLEDVGPLAPAGMWTLTLTKGPNTAETTIKAWVRRDETLRGFPEYGRQSVLSDGRYSRYLRAGEVPSPYETDPVIGQTLGYDPQDRGAVRRSGTLSGFAAGDKPPVIGATVRSNNWMSDYSASGPTNTAHRVGPDASAPGDDSTVLSGVLSAGSSSGSMLALSGTSVAAPQVARWIADRLAVGDPVNRTVVSDAAAQGGLTPKPPEFRSGGGVLPVPNLFGGLRGPLP